MLNNYIKQIQLFLEASYKQNRFYLKVQLNQFFVIKMNQLHYNSFLGAS